MDKHDLPARCDYDSISYVWITDQELNSNQRQEFLMQKLFLL